MVVTSSSWDRHKEADKSKKPPGQENHPEEVSNNTGKSQHLLLTQVALCVPRPMRCLSVLAAHW